MTVSLVALAVGLTAGSALADRPTVDASVGLHASAETGECTDVEGTTICLMEHVSVSREGRTTQVCVQISTTIHPPDGEPTATIEHGCTTTSRDVFSIDRQLTTATLQQITVPTTVEVYDAEGNVTSTEDSATVSGVWTGIGVVMLDRNRLVSHTEDCTTVSVSSREWREATATLTIDGETVGTSYGELTKTRSLAKYCDDIAE